MKKITTILLLVIANICNGQDSSKSTYPVMGLTLARSAYNWELPHTKDFDTIPVILICIDTTIKDEGGATFWVKAIKINKYVRGGWTTGDYYRPAHWEHHRYLRRNMQPLNYIVTQEL